MADATSRLRLVVDSSGVSTANKTLKETRENARALDETVEGLKGAFLSLAAIAGISFGAEKILQYANAWQETTNQIKVVSKSIGEVTAAQEGLFAIAQKTNSSYEATVELYAAIERSSKGFVANQAEVFKIIENVDKALAAAGANKDQQMTVAQQLGLSLETGHLQARGLRSLTQNAPLVVEGLSESISKPGESAEAAHARLQEMVKEGAVTNQVLLKGLEQMTKLVDDAFAKIQPTIERAFGTLQDKLSEFIGTSGAGIFSGIADGILLLANNLETVAKVAVIAGTAMTTAFVASNIVGWIENAAKAMKALTVAAAENPFVAIAVVIAAAAAAFYEFSDSMKVASGTFTATNKALKGEVLSYSVSVQDVLGQIPAVLGDNLAKMGDSVAAWLSKSFGPDSLKKISDFFMSALNFAKGFVNAQIGLFVGLPVAIGYALAHLPDIITDVFIRAYNAAGKALTDFVNKNRDVINLMLKGIGLITGIPAIEIPPLDWKPMVDSAAPAARAVGDAFKNVFTTDYVGAGIKSFSGLWDAATAKAVAYKKNVAEANALKNLAGKSTDGYGNGEDDAAGKAGKSAGNAFKESFNKAAFDEGLAKSFNTDLTKVFQTGLKTYSDELQKAHQAITAANDDIYGLDVGAASNDPMLAKALQQTAKDGKDYFTSMVFGTTNAAWQALLSQARELEAKWREIADKQARDDALNEVSTGLATASQDFWTAIVSGDKEGLKHVGVDLKDMLTKVTADAMQSGFKPVLDWLDSQLRDVFASVFDSLKGGLRDIEGSISGAFDKLSPGLGKSLGDLFKSGVQAYADYSVGHGVAGALGLAGHSAAQQQNSEVGGAIGTAIGLALTPILGPLGPILGALGGSVLGGLLGPSKQWQTAQAALAANGSVIGAIGGDKASDANISSLGTAITAIAAAAKSLTGLGATLGVTISSAALGNYGGNFTDSSGQFSATGASAADLANAAGIDLLKNATFANQALNSLKDGMIAAGQSFDDTYAAVASVSQALQAQAPQLDEVQQALKNIHDTFDPLIAQTTAYTDANKALVGAMGQVLQAVADQVNQSNSDALQQLVDPAGYQVSQLMKDETASIEDATKAGADLNLVYQLNAAKTKDLAANLGNSADAFDALSKAFETMVSAAQAAGQNVDALSQSFSGGFDTSISDQIKTFVNSPTDQLNDLLTAEAKRLDYAKEIGANLDQVNRLTALEQQGFFKGLSDDALKQVQDFLGLFSQATNTVVQNLDLSRQDLQSRADAFGQYAQTYATANSDLTNQYLVASPRQSIDALRAQVQTLLGGVNKGDDAAAQALPDAVSKLVDAARSTFGNSKDFSDILAFAQNALTTGQQSALNVQTAAQQQIAALDANNDILSDIRGILASSQASNAFFQSFVDGGVATSDALIAAIQQGTGLTAAANDNASALSLTGLIGQSIQPIIAPLATSIDAFTDKLSTLPQLQQITIQAVNQGSANIVSALADVSARLNRIELLEIKQLEELEEKNAA